MAEVENSNIKFNNDLEMFEQARNRVQKKMKNKCVTNKDVIIDQEKEIEQYRERIKRMTRIINELIKTNMEWQTLQVTSNEDGSTEQCVDYITETFYCDEKIIKEVTIQYK